MTVWHGRNLIYYYLCQGGYVYAFVDLSVERKLKKLSTSFDEFLEG